MIFNGPYMYQNQRKIHDKISETIRTYKSENWNLANFTLFHLGMSLGWTSPVVIILQDKNQTVLPEPLTDKQRSWLVSISILMDVFFLTITGYIVDTFGRKTSLLLTCVPRLIYCLLCVFANKFWMLLVARLFCGFCNGTTIVSISTYTSEIASKEVRGALGTISQISSNLGVTLMYCVGPYVSYMTLNIVQITIIAVTSVGLFFIPETPYFLCSKEQAIKALKNIRQNEMEVVEEVKQFSSNKEKVDKKQMFKDKIVMKTLGKVLFMGVLSQLSGAIIVQLYLQTIFEMTNTKSISSSLSSAISGCIGLFACCCTMYLSDRFGRKPVISVSLIGISVGTFGLGTFFYLSSDGTNVTGFLNYLPLLAIVLSIYSFNAGIGPLQWLLFAELFDDPFRAIGVSLGLNISFITAFLLTRFISDLMVVLGTAGTFWLFGVCCIVDSFFILFFVPETKGKSIRQIQKELGRYDEEIELCDSKVEQNKPKGTILN